MGSPLVVTNHTIEWKKSDTWTTNTSARKVITFENARYPLNDFMPYFSIKTPMDENFSYEMKVINPVYIPLTSEDMELLDGATNFSETPTANTYTISSGNEKILETLILPFVFREQSVLKLASFDLSTEKTVKPQRASSAKTQTYAASSVLKTGKFVKIRISESGVYKLTYEQLKNMGINPQNVRIFGYGGAEIPFDFTKSIDDLPEVAIWNTGNYILFYAQGVTSWSYNKSVSLFTHQGNTYSQYGYYFVTSDAGAGKRIQQKSPLEIGSGTVHNVNDFLDYQLYEKDSRTLISSGREFYGEIFDVTTSYDFSFNFPNIVSSLLVTARLDVAAASPKGNPSSFSLKLNNSLQTNNLAVDALSGDNHDTYRSSTAVYSYTPNDDDNLVFNLKYNKPVFSAKGYLNFIEINAHRKLTMLGAAMPFRNVDYINTDSYSKYELSNANSNILIWDITDLQNIEQVPVERTGQTLSFYASNTSLCEFLAIDPTASYPAPETVGEVANQNLHGLPQIDFLIITHPDFTTEANRLAEAHREFDGMLVEVVTTEQVYNEFSSGAPDASAYRRIMKMFYDRASEGGVYPKNLLLLGRGSYDNKGLFSNSGHNLVLTFQAKNSVNSVASFVTDDFFAYMDDAGNDESIESGAGKMAFGVGRFPVVTKQQAQNVVNKNIAYMKNENRGAWKNQLCFIADDGDKSLHAEHANELATYLSKNHSAYQINKIYLDTYIQEKTAGGEQYPLAKDRFNNLIRSGIFYLNFTGHAGRTGWTNEQILTTNDVLNMSNKHQPLCFAATCDFILFDNSLTISAGEQMFLNPVGGAIGVISSARVVYASNNSGLNKAFGRYILKKENGQHLTVGEILKFGKNEIGIEQNKLSYVLMGNPALKLSYPTRYNVITTQINDNINQGNDTLRALSTTTVKGIIADDMGNRITGFNGIVSVTIYDKEQRITTLNNDGSETGGYYTYIDRPNLLFSGTEKVEDGNFSITFMLPKDIKYNYGTGRINYYAKDDNSKDEAQGYFENFIVGGDANILIEDTEGPIIEKIYLNHENFVSKGKVNETPYFVATVSDENGINTVGSGIGHDMTLTVDNNPNQSYVLNSYYEAEMNSYKRGTVRYKFSELTEGKHALTFKVWDLLNNSTTVVLDFDVVKGLQPEIFSVINYPNPITTYTVFKILHDRPETVLNTRVDVFDLSGRVIWTSEHPTTGEIHYMDLSAGSGINVRTGLYLYRVSITTTEGKFVSKTNKMIIQK